MQDYECDLRPREKEMLFIFRTKRRFIITIIIYVSHTVKTKAYLLPQFFNFLFTHTTYVIVYCNNKIKVINFSLCP